MPDVNARMLYELLATLSSFLAMRYEFRPTRSVLVGRRRPRGRRIREESRDRRELGGLHSELKMGADERRGRRCERVERMSENVERPPENAETPSVVDETPTKGQST